ESPTRFRGKSLRVATGATAAQLAENPTISRLARVLPFLLVSKGGRHHETASFGRVRHRHDHRSRPGALVVVRADRRGDPDGRRREYVGRLHRRARRLRRLRRLLLRARRLLLRARLLSLSPLLLRQLAASTTAVLAGPG